MEMERRGGLWRDEGAASVEPDGGLALAEAGLRVGARLGFGWTRGALWSGKDWDASCCGHALIECKVL